jgi:hypothetical protein
MSMRNAEWPNQVSCMASPSLVLANRSAMIAPGGPVGNRDAEAR